MKRWIINIISGLSLLLCVSIPVLWVQSYWRCDQLAYHVRYHDGDSLHTVSLQSWAGTLLLICEEWQRGGDKKAVLCREVSEKPYEEIDPSEIRVNVVGFQLAVYDRIAPDVDGWAFTVPLWAIWLFCAGCLAVSLRVWWTTRCQAPGFCLIGGYDLRATPECGTPTITALPKQTEAQDLPI